MSKKSISTNKLTYVKIISYKDAIYNWIHRDNPDKKTDRVYLIFEDGRKKKDCTYSELIELIRHNDEGGAFGVVCYAPSFLDTYGKGDEQQ